MSDTVTLPKEERSRILGVSLRGWIAFMVVWTVCLMSIWGMEVKEPLYTLAGMVIGYYFAQDKKL